MTTKTIIKEITTFISLAIMILFLTVNDSFAQRWDRRYNAPRHTHREKVIIRKHAGHGPGWTDRRGFRYYRPFRSGYYPGKARFIRRLPVGYRTTWIGNNIYFFYNGTYYERVPYGYVILESPPETVVVRETSTVYRPMSPASGNVTVTVSTLNVRSGPGLDYSLVEQVVEGSILEVHGKTDDGWLYVESKTGQSGWVKSVFTEPLDPGSG